MSALIGGGIAVVAGWAVERGRWKREDRRHERDTRTTLYADYLAAVLAAREQMWHASRWSELPHAERTAMARDALRDFQVYPLRHRISLVAPTDIGESAYEVIKRLIDYRDAVIEGAADGDAEFERVRVAFNETRRVLSDRMRSDLNSLR
ncbi:hypothetical protein ACFZAE_39845 [Streptomyces scabiei]|uniref:hypothetical protein n=1 Tax=Streptomyces scabiei TaxID=1930 RepID=UPI0036EF520D